MISVQTGMLVALGFLMASLLALLLASAFWSRAVRLTTKRLKESLPVSEPEMKADLDRLRAAYAIKVHKLETQLQEAKLERARQLIEINRRDASISALETDMVVIKAELDENANARRVLEQTVSDRLPKVEARLAEAKRLLSNREREIAELAQGAKRHKAALEEATSINAQRSAEIERLTNALVTSGRRRGEGGPEGEVALRAEAEALRSKTREQAALIDRLQRRLGEGYLGGGTTSPAQAAPGGNPVQNQMERLRESLADAEQTLQAARTGPPDRTSVEQDRELRALKARADDQAGEIARLKAALAAFEQADGADARTSRLALKARVGSAEAKAERQAATIAKLRAELAAANERLAHQAAHFMEEMRRLGSGAAPGQTRRAGWDGQRQQLSERVAQVPGRVPEPAAASTSQANQVQPDASKRPPGNGQEPENAEAAESGTDTPSTEAIPENGTAATKAPESETAQTDAAAPEAAQPAPRSSDTAPAATGTAAAAGPPPIAAAAAAEMPQTAAIPEGRRRVRLLDRITGLGKA